MAICLPKKSSCIIFSLILSWGLLRSNVNGKNYSDVMTLLEDKLNSKTYNKDLRPKINQSECIDTSVSFKVIGFTGVADEAQKFTLIGYFNLSWKDELVRWNPDEYGGLEKIHIESSRIWRPKMWQRNAGDEYDPFQNHYSTTTVTSDGNVTWVPTGSFTSSCFLNLEKYPFDINLCSMVLCPMYYQKQEVTLVPESRTIGIDILQDKKWTMEKTSLSTIELGSGDEASSCLYMEFEIKRRPMFFIINSILPIILISFLHNLVFLIPVHSGAGRIGYGIKVLLSLSVLVSVVSTLVPHAADVLPHVTVYLFIIHGEACFTILACLLIDNLYAREVKKKKRDASKPNIELDQATELQSLNKEHQTTEHRSKDAKETNTIIRQSSLCDMCPCRKGVSAKFVNKMCFVMGMLIWGLVNIWYFAAVQ